MISEGQTEHGTGAGEAGGGAGEKARRSSLGNRKWFTALGSHSVIHIINIYNVGLKWAAKHHGLGLLLSVSSYLQHSRWALHEHEFQWKNNPSVNKNYVNSTTFAQNWLYLNVQPTCADADRVWTSARQLLEENSTYKTASVRSDACCSDFLWSNKPKCRAFAPTCNTTINPLGCWNQTLFCLRGQWLEKQSRLSHHTIFLFLHNLSE